MNRTARQTIDTIAYRNEDAAIAVMRAAERTGDEIADSTVIWPPIP
ncbi:hypothetical protein [Aquipseudomonas alcaligenes]|nr:hypothetical protein [Pseudomonas alcaligenes]